MARPLRFHCPGAATHVSGRAAPTAGAAFCNDAERADFLGLVGRAAERSGWLVHAYCLVEDRYDLLLEADGRSLSRGMREVAGPFTQRANRRRGTTGPVFRGRYKAVLVNSDDAHALLDLVRWIALSPVRAGLAASPRDWPWSSHAAVVGVVLAPPWLETGWLLSRFDRVHWAARSAYARFVEERGEAGEGPADPGRLVRRQVALGPEGFAERLAPSAEAPAAPAHPLAWYDEAFRDRHEAMAKAWLSGDFTQAAVARHFGVHFSTVSRAASRRLPP